MDVQNLFRQWLYNKDLSERTIKEYIYYFNRFTYPKFNQESVGRFLVEVKGSPGGRGFITNYQKFLMKNRKELEIDDNYYSDIAEVELVRSGRREVKLIRPLSDDEIYFVEKHLVGEELKLMLMISYKSGLRLSELLSITVNSFNWNVWQKDMRLMGECIVYGKGRQEGVAVVPPELMKRISQFIHSGKFNGKDIGSKLFKMGERTWQMKLRKAGFDAGITKLNDKGKAIKETVVHPHRLRHSLGGNLIKEGMDIRYIQKVLRHKSIQSTQRYTHLDKEDVKKKYMELEREKERKVQEKVEMEKLDSSVEGE